MSKKTVITVLILLCLIMTACDNTGVPSATKTPAGSAAGTPAPTQTPEITATPVPKINLAFEKPVECDVYQDEYLPEYAVDGDYSTRWSGAAQSEATYHYLIIDLENEYRLGNIYVEWEAIGHSYRLSAAKTIENGGDWTFLSSRPKPAELTEEFNLGGITARYIKLEFSKSAYCSIYELEIYEYDESDPGNNGDTKENIALGKTAVSDFVETADVDYSAGKAVDGDLLTRWSPGAGAATDVLTWYLDLGEVYSIKEIIIFFESCNTAYTLSVSVDNQKWTAVYEGESTSEPEITVTLDNTKARYICFSRPGGDWGSFYEFVVRQADSGD